MDRVLFHILTGHRCEGGPCECTPDVSFPAKVLKIHEEDGALVGLSLEIEFPDAELPTVEITDHEGRIRPTAVWKGFIAYQDFSPPALSDPPESGTWTELS